MLSKRIAGILKQYPNPEVAFFATEVLLSNVFSSYLKSSFRYSRYLRKKGDYLTLLDGRPEDSYALFSKIDPIEKIEQTKWYVYPDGTVAKPISGRELLQRDLAQMGTTLPDAVREYLASGKWYDDKSLSTTYRTEVMSTWVASWVNRWLKGFSKITTLGELVDHYNSILEVARDIGDVCDYVAAARIDPAHLTMSQLVYRSRRWHAAQRRDAMAAAAPPSERVYDRDKYGIFKLTTRAALEHEGNFMGHCVGRYWTDVNEGRCEIYSVRNLDGKSVATIEVRPPGAGHYLLGSPSLSSMVIQIKGPANRAVTKPPELCDTIYYFLESIGAKNNTGSCMKPSEARENPDDSWDEWDEGADAYENPDDEGAPGGYRPIFAVKTNFPDADLWVIRKGTPEKVGSVTKTFSPEHVGVKVLATDLVLPDYLYYVLMHIHARGFYQDRARGTLRLKNIRTDDVKDALRLLRF